MGEWADSGNTKPAAPLELSCTAGKITRVEAFFGTPLGDCAGFSRGACDAPTAQAVVDKLCLHQARCSVPTAANESHWQGTSHPSPLAALFLPDPCMGTAKHLAVKVTCSSVGNELHGRSPPAPPPTSPPPSPALGIDATEPRFSWKLASTLRGDTQVAYELKVIHFFGSSTVWASGKVASATHTLVPYGGAPLAALGAFSWSVRWWSSMSGSATPSEFSVPQRFDMAATAASWAAAQWVGGGNQLRSEFTLSSAPVSATLMVAGLGLAKPFLNGKRVADHAMGPQSQLFTRVLYTTIDVTAHIRAGDNALGMMLGTGKYGCKQVAIPPRLPV